MSEVINIKELNERIERESVFVDTLRQLTVTLPLSVPAV